MSFDVAAPHQIQGPRRAALPIGPTTQVTSAAEEVLLPHGVLQATGDPTEPTRSADAGFGTGIHELFVLDAEMHRVIMSGADATLLHAAARRQGMVTLYEDGLRKVVRGETSMEELLRVTQDQSEDEPSLAALVVLLLAAAVGTAATLVLLRLRRLVRTSSTESGWVCTSASMLARASSRPRLSR